MALPPITPLTRRDRDEFNGITTSVPPAAPAPPRPKPMAAPLVGTTTPAAPLQRAAIAPPAGGSFSEPLAPAPAIPRVARPPLAQRIGAGIRAVADAQRMPGQLYRSAVNAGFANARSVLGDVTAGITGDPNVQYVETPQTPAQAARALSTRPIAQSPATAAAAPVTDITQRPVQTMRTLTVQPGQTTADGTTSVNGRPLGYGEMVNGVRTFSDGSGQGRGGVPRTMSEMQLAQLSRPTPNGIGGPEATANLRIPQRPQLPAAAGAPAGPSPLELARYAASDAAAIASGDVRSPLGSAARQLRNRIASAGTLSERRAAQAQLDALSAGVGEPLRVAQEQAGGLAREQTRAAADLQRTGMEGDARIAEARITSPRVQPQQLTLDDGTVGLVGEDAIARPVTGIDGRPVRTTLPRQATLSPSDRAKAINELATSMGGVNGVTEDTYRQAAALVDGGGQQQRPGLDQFLAAARQANPGVSDADLRAYYAQNYGG